MKLLRLTTTDKEGIFDTQVDGELIINPDTKVALQSLTLEQDDQFIVIDDTNDTFTWSSQNGQSATITFPHQVISHQNFQTYLDQFTKLLNNSVAYDFNVPYNSLLGMEWLVNLNQKQRITIQHSKGVVGEHQDQFTLADNVNKVANVWAIHAVQPPDMNTYRYNMLFRKFTSRGTGFVRCQIYKAIHTGAGNVRQGVLIGLSKTNLAEVKSEDFTVDMIDFGLHLTLTGAGGNYTTQTKAIESGTFANLNYVGEGDAGNDYMEVMKTGTEVIAHVYSPAGLQHTSVIATGVDSEKLYPFIVFHEDVDHISVHNLRTVVSPFENSVNILTKEDDLSVGAPPMPSTGRTNNFIDFNTLTLAEFLGYPTQRRPEDGFRVVRNAEFIASSIFKPRYFVQSMIVEMLNIKLDSYDGLPSQKKRKSILAFVPQSNQDRITVYEPNTQNFIDLKNKEPQLLRSVRARIVQGDYTKINLLGQASLVLLIDG